MWSKYWDIARGHAERLIEEAQTIWEKGGWAMYALATVALVMFWVGMRIWVRMAESRAQRVPEKTWRRWITRPGERYGSIGKLLDFVSSGPNDSVRDTAMRFEELQIREIQPYERDLKVMKVCVSAAPLVGLLGTVTGMLATFGALSSGSGGSQTLDKIAKGISEALITTETGLVIALPGLFFQYFLNRRVGAYRAFLTHIETLYLQKMHRAASQRERDEIEAEARRVIARRLAERLQSPNQVPAGTTHPSTSNQPV